MFDAEVFTVDATHQALQGWILFNQYSDTDVFWRDPMEQAWYERHRSLTTNKIECNIFHIDTIISVDLSIILLNTIQNSFFFLSVLLAIQRKRI